MTKGAQEFVKTIVQIRSPHDHNSRPIKKDIQVVLKNIEPKTIRKRDPRTSITLGPSSTLRFVPNYYHFRPTSSSPQKSVHRSLGPKNVPENCRDKSH